MKRYSTNLTDSQWNIVDDLLKDKRPRKYEIRKIFDSIFYLLKTGCQWRMLPLCFPPWETVYYYFTVWKHKGTIPNLKMKTMKTTSIIILSFLTIFSVMSQPQKKKPQNPSQQLGYKVNNSVIQTVNVNIPDSTFKAELIKQGVDKNNDGQIQINEALIVDSLYLDFKPITSLTGINSFTNLKILYCNYSKITTLDLSMNKALKKLHCSESKLVAIDISKNTELEVLDCSHNKLSVLDVSLNTALTRLSCSVNKLVVLDVSKNIALTMLACNNNKIKVLDVSKNTLLTGLYCSANQLLALDVSKNTALTTLYCSVNILEVLNFSKNTALKTLNCSTNILSVLDVSKNTSLTNLQCNGNDPAIKICINANQLGLTKSKPKDWKKDDTASWIADCAK